MFNNGLVIQLDRKIMIETSCFFYNIRGVYILLGFI